MTEKQRAKWINRVAKILAKRVAEAWDEDVDEELILSMERAVDERVSLPDYEWLLDESPTSEEVEFEIIDPIGRGMA